MEKSWGPWINPCGTAQRKGLLEEVVPLMLTFWDWSGKYDSNQAMTDPLMPAQVERLSSKILWSTVSNVVDRSKKTRATACPELVANMMSLWSCKRNVLKEWPFFYVDWNGSWRLFDIQWSIVLMVPTYSTIFFIRKPGLILV